MHYDGVIVTGAPVRLTAGPDAPHTGCPWTDCVVQVEHLPFEDVLYWSELTSIFEWIRETKVCRRIVGTE